jgi:hypothetical protein
MRIEPNSKPDYQTPITSNAQQEIVLTEEEQEDTIEKD